MNDVKNMILESWIPLFYTDFVSPAPMKKVLKDLFFIELEVVLMQFTSLFSFRHL